MKRITIVLLVTIILSACGKTAPSPDELTPHNKELTEKAVNAIDDYLSGDATKSDTNDILISLYKSYDIEGMLVDAKVADCAIFVVDNQLDKVIAIRNDLADLVGMEAYTPPKLPENDDIDKIVVITNSYLLGEKTNKQAADDLMSLYLNLENSGIDISSDMKMLYSIISTSSDPKKDKKEIMKYRNKIAIIKEVQ